MSRYYYMQKRQILQIYKIQKNKRKWYMLLEERRVVNPGDMEGVMVGRGQEGSSGC